MRRNLKTPNLEWRQARCDDLEWWICGHELGVMTGSSLRWGGGVMRGSVHMSFETRLKRLTVSRQAARGFGAGRGGLEVRADRTENRNCLGGRVPTRRQVLL